MCFVQRLFLTTACLLFLAIPLAAQPRILDVASGETLNLDQLTDRLLQTRILFIGEQHDHAGHHQMQLAIIRALARHQSLAIGLEMFQAQAQSTLDEWSAATISEADFRQVYQRNWGWWSLYEPIFSYAREYRIPLVGLNVPRSITRQVALSGFSSLDDEQIRFLGNMTCEVDATYEDFIRRAVGAHGHGSFNFRNFCEAQLVWDKAMAHHMSLYLKQHPEKSAVVLAGSGHSWKYGIPTQIAALGHSDYLVLLPEVQGGLTRDRVTLEDADFLWLDLGEASWTVEERDN